MDCLPSSPFPSFSPTPQVMSTDFAQLNAVSYWRWDQGDLSLIQASLDFFKCIGLNSTTDASPDNLYPASLGWRLTNFFVNGTEAQQVITNLALGGCLSGYVQTDWYFYMNRRIKCQWLIHFNGANASSSTNFDVELKLFLPTEKVDHTKQEVTCQTHEPIPSITDLFDAQTYRRQKKSSRRYPSRHNLKISSEPKLTYGRSQKHTLEGIFSANSPQPMDEHRDFLPSVGMPDSRASLATQMDSLSLDKPHSGRNEDSYLNGGGHDQVATPRTSPYQALTISSCPSILDSRTEGPHPYDDILKKRRITVDPNLRHQILGDFKGFETFSELGQSGSPPKSGSWCPTGSKSPKPERKTRSSISFLLN